MTNPIRQIDREVAEKIAAKINNQNFNQFDITAISLLLADNYGEDFFFNMEYWTSGPIEVAEKWYSGASCVICAYLILAMSSIGIAACLKKAMYDD